MPLRSASVGFLEILVASVLVAGCGSFELEEPQALRSAQQQLAEAKRDPAVRRHGAIFLRDAEQTLDRARFGHADPAQARHLAYLAKRKVEIARSITGLQVASENLQALAEKSIAADAVASRRADRAKAADTAAPKRRTGAANAKTRKAALPVVATAAAAGTADRPKPPPKSPVASAVTSAVTSAMASNAGAASDQSARGPGAGEDPPSQEIVISGVFSDFERAMPSPDVQRSLAPLVRYLRDNRNSRIIVAGYAGGPGGPGGHEHSLSQSLGIAEAVKSYLTGEGIDGGRIFTLGRGASGPADDGGGAQPGMVNSRIEIGLFQGIGDPTPALSSRAAPSAAPVPPPP